jgi:hypothetical protein
MPIMAINTAFQPINGDGHPAALGLFNHRGR